MRRLAGTLLLLMLLGAGPPDKSKNLTAIKNAHSIVSEWALINREAAARKLTHRYTEEMRRDALSQLAKTAKEMPASAPGAREVARLSKLPGDSDPALLNAGVSRLLNIEKQLESD